MVCHLGENYSTAKEDQLCPDLKLVWVSKFRLLGLDFDSRLEKLKIVAEDLILKWKRRMLTTLGRINIAKALIFISICLLLHLHRCY